MRTTRPTVWRAAFVTATLMLMLVSCNGGETEQAQDKRERKPATAPPTPTAVASATPDADTKNVEVAVNRVTVDEHGFAIVHWTLTNPGSTEIEPGRHFGDAYDIAGGPERHWAYFDGTLPGIELVSKEAGMRYFSLSTEERCLCSSDSYNVALSRDEGTARFYSTYYIDPEITKVTVELPGFKPMRNVPVEHIN